jgi:hypothetical protein
VVDRHAHHTNLTSDSTECSGICRSPSCAIRSRCWPTGWSRSTPSASGCSSATPIRRDDLGTISPYITSKTRRFGDWVVNLEPPDDQVARLNLPERRTRTASSRPRRSSARVGCGACRRDGARPWLNASAPETPGTIVLVAAQVRILLRRQGGQGGAGAPLGAGRVQVVHVGGAAQGEQVRGTVRLDRLLGRKAGVPSKAKPRSARRTTPGDRKGRVSRSRTRPEPPRTDET